MKTLTTIAVLAFSGLTFAHPPIDCVTKLEYDKIEARTELRGEPMPDIEVCPCVSQLVYDKIEARLALRDEPMIRVDICPVNPCPQGFIVHDTQFGGGPYCVPYNSFNTFTQVLTCHDVGIFGKQFTPTLYDVELLWESPFFIIKSVEEQVESD